MASDLPLVSGVSETIVASQVQVLLCANHADQSLHSLLCVDLSQVGKDSPDQADARVGNAPPILFLARLFVVVQELGLADVCATCLLELSFMRGGQMARQPL